MDFHIQPCINAQPKEKITLLHISLFAAKLRIKSDKQKNVAKLLADRRFRKMA